MRETAPEASNEKLTYAETNPKFQILHTLLRRMPGPLKKSVTCDRRRPDPGPAAPECDEVLITTLIRTA